MFGFCSNDKGLKVHNFPTKLDKSSQGRDGGQLAFARVLKMNLPGQNMDKHCLPLL
jgi:hypothetical protein